jgi:hypothetical protein
VNKYCFVDFKIGPYEDKVLCDMVPMDAFHILLGRPWKYDKNVVHHGKENTSMIQHEGKHHILNPFKDEEETELTSLSLTTMGCKNFSKETKDGFFYLLYP